MRKLKLLFLATAALFSAGAWAQTEWTGDISNADGLSFTTKYAEPSSDDVAETWTSTSSTTHAFDINQSLTGVPDGVYELSAQAMYRASLDYGIATNCVLYATVGETTFSTPIANFGDYTANENRAQIGTQMQNNNAYLNKVPAVIVEGGNVTIGMKSIGELAYCTNGYWFVYKKSTFTFKDITEIYHAKLISRANTMLASAPESDAKTTLNSALTTYATANLANVKALQAAINTFLETATVSDPLNVTPYITNPSFDDDSGNKKNWIQDLGYKQPSDIYQPTGWNMLYSSAKVNNTQYQTYKTQTDNAKDGNCYYVRQRWGDVYAVVDLHQQIKELPAGVYRLTVAVKGGSSVTDANTLKMTAGNNTNTTAVNDFDKSNYKDYSVQITKDNADEDIDISFGWKQQTGGEQLYYVDDFRLYYLGDPLKAAQAEWQEAYDAAVAACDADDYASIVGTERTALSTAISTYGTKPASISDCETAVTALNKAKDDFIAALQYYVLLDTEKTKASNLGMTAEAIAEAAATTKTGLQALKDLKVAEYNYVSTTYKYGVALSDTWTSTGTNTSAATFSNEHWSGTTHEYKNQNDNNGQGWNATSWTLDFNQDVTLPAGNYVFKVAGRKATGENTVMSLVVKNGETVLGMVSDFPESNAARGINKNGATSYDEADDQYANGGKGYGWEWRYVKFNLATDATVNVGISAEGKAIHQWISFGDYTLQTNDETNIALIAYNVAFASAQTTLANTADYGNVTGSEKSALEEAIAADATLNKTSKTDIEDATTALNDAVAAFTAAKASYDAFVAAKAVEYSDNMPYASAVKFAAIATAQAATATSAADADTKTTAIISAYRKYVESNALAEGVAGAENKTSLIADPNMDVTYDGTNHTFGAWTVIGQTNGTIKLLDNQSFTDGDGYANYKYADIYKNDNNAGIQQTLSNLPAGNYMLTVTARANTTSDASFVVFAGNTTANIQRIGNSGGVFDRGWNDASVEFCVAEDGDVNIGVQSGNGKDLWWSATRFRLVKLPNVVIDEDVDYTAEAATKNVTLTRTIKADTWNTFCVPFAINNTELKAAFGDDVAVAVFSETANGVNSTINFNTMAEPAVAANTPVLLKTSTPGTSYTFNGRTIETGDAQVAGGTNFNFVGTYAASTTIASGDYFIGSNQLWKSAGSTTIAGTRAYIKAATTGARIIGFTIDDEEVTAIDGIELGRQDDGKTYNLAGQQVTAPAKGLYIRNGKKVVVR